MTLNEIEEKLSMIRSYAENDDDEGAHSREDALHRAVIEHVARHGDTECRALAQAALRSRETEFSRWCS